MQKIIKIDGKIISEKSPCFIIAEAGVNHNGSIKLAKKLIDEAKAMGADAIKFQTYRTEELVAKDAPKADYQKKSAPRESQFEMLKRLELSDNDFFEIQKYCKAKKIIFLSSCFDSPSAKLLQKLNVPAFKIGSGELTNFPLLRQVAKYNKPIILSTGMSDLSEVRKAVSVIYKAGNKSLIILHCTTNYPSDPAEANLRAIKTLENVFKVPIGFSDHTEGIIVTLTARALGAQVIEKHFTLDKSMSGPDHKASMEPQEFKLLVKGIRTIETALGDGKKVTQKSELNIRQIARKSIFSACAIKKGDKIKEKMLVLKRPGTGIGADKMSKIIGKIAAHNIAMNSMLKLGDIKNA